MPVEKILVVSTGHLDPGTARRMEVGARFGIEEVISREYGYIMFPHAIEAAYEDGNAVPECIRRLAVEARHLDCEILMLDRDGEEHEGLPMYDW